MFSDLGVESAKKKAVYEEVNAISKEITELESKKEKLEKKLHPKYNKLDLLEKGIKDIERLIATTTTDNKKERELIKEIQLIKQSKPFIEEINELLEQIRNKKQEKYKAGEGLSALKSEVSVLKAAVNKLKKEQDGKEVNKEHIQKDLDKINQQRNALRTEIAELRKKKEAEKEQYYRKMIEYEAQQIVIREIEWIAKTKRMVVERDEQQKKWEEEKQQRIEERKKRIEDQIKKEENMRKREEEYRKLEEEKQKKWEEHMLSKFDIHPYLSEIDLCDYLIKYCQKQLGNGLPAGSLPHQPLTDFEKQQITEELRRKTIQEALEKGKLARAETKEERTQKDSFAISAKQQAKPAQRRVAQQQPEDSDQLNLDFLLIQKFSQIKISAPMKKSDL